MSTQSSTGEWMLLRSVYYIVSHASDASVQYGPYPQ